MGESSPPARRGLAAFRESLCSTSSARSVWSGGVALLSSSFCTSDVVPVERGRMSNGDTSLRTRRQSNAAPSNGGRFPAAAAPFPPPSSSSRGGPPPQDGSRRNGGPPPSASSGSNSATARPKSNVGARLLKKRQSVSYQTAVNGGISLPVGVIPGVPSLPTVLPPPVPSAGASAQPSSSSAMTGVGAGGKQRSASPIPPGGVTGTGAEGKFAALGVDIELLAAESFRPEECERAWLRPFHFEGTSADD